MLTLDARKTALVVIDLQEGILPFAGGPHAADEVVSRAARLAEKCRAIGAPVVMVRVGWSADFAEALKQPVDAQAPHMPCRKTGGRTRCRWANATAISK